MAGGDDASSIRDIEVKVVPPPALNGSRIRLVSPEYTGIATQTLAAGPDLVPGAGRDADRARCPGQQAPGRRRAASGRPAGTRQRRVQRRPDRLPDELPGQGQRGVLVRAEGHRGIPEPRLGPLRRPHVQGRGAPRRHRRAKDRPRRPRRCHGPRPVELDDDFGLHSARLSYKVSAGDSEPHEAVAIPLWAAPGEEPGVAQPAFVKHQEIGYEWNLAPLKLAIGSIITFHADARDFDSIKGPNLGKSRELRLRIVSKEDAARQLDDGRRELREEIARILAMQRQAITPVDDAARTLARTDRLPRSQRDDLNNAGLIQRQVGSRMSNRDDGLEQKLRRLLDDLRNFKIANPDAQQQMQNMLERLDMLRDRNLGPAEQGLTRAGKSLEQIAEPPPGSATPKDEAAKPAADQPQGGKDQSPSQAARTKAKTSKAARTTRTSRVPSRRQDGPEQGRSAGSRLRRAQGSGRLPRMRSLDEQSGQAGSEQPQASAARFAPGHCQAIAGGGQDQPEGHRRRASEDARGPQRVRDLPRRGQGRPGPAEEAGRDDEAGRRGGHQARPHGQDGRGALARAEGRAGQPRRAPVRSRQGLAEPARKMDELGKRLDESDPLAAAAMREAAGNSRKQGTAAKMGEAADQLEKNQMGQARAQQEKARQDLQELVDSVQNRRERELSRLVKELKNAEAELRKLRKRQAQNLKATREAKQNPDAKNGADQLKKLAKEQAEIQKELEAAAQAAGQAQRRARRPGRAPMPRARWARPRRTSTRTRETRPTRTRKKPSPT